jgi:hypothetical protein
MVMTFHPFSRRGTGEALPEPPVTAF